MSLSETELDQKIGEFTTKIKELVGVMADSRESDKARWEAADTERERLAGELDSLKEARDVEVRKARTEKAVADMERMLAGTRSPSKASLIGGGRSASSEYEAGQFLTALFEARNQDYNTQQQGKARLGAMGSRTVERGSAGVLELGPDGDAGKAILGTTGATGAYIMPNAVVEKLVTIATALNPMRDLLTVISGVATPTIAIPVEASAATRAVVAAWGSLKSNQDITFAQYTATFYTLAKIHDVANQLLRYSAGAAEADVTGRLGRSMALGEAYYILSGSGTNEPTGIITALTTATPTYDTADIAGYATPNASVYGAIATAVGALENRNRTVDGAVMNPVDFWTYLALEGSAIRPYFNSYIAGQPLPTTDNKMSPLFGVPIVRNSNCPAGTLVVGEFKSATLYTGLGYRIDTSDQAGTRWDYNETGYRAEEEIAFNATPYVVAGMFQRVTSVGT